MKTISFVKKHLIWGIALMIGAVAMSFNSSSKKAEHVKEMKSTTYHFIGNDMIAGAFSDPANWSTTDNGVACQTEDPQLPCVINVPAGEDLNSFLAGRSNSDVLKISVGYKLVQ